MKKIVLATLAAFVIANLLGANIAPNISLKNQTQIDLAQKQYQEALGKVSSESPEYLECLKNKQCDSRKLQEIKRSIVTNLGTMRAALTTMTSRIRGQKLTELMEK